MKTPRLSGFYAAGIALMALSACSGENVHVERSTTIDAPMDFVKDHVDDFEHINAWSPWTKKDPDMTTSLEGTDGEVGCKYSWQGNDEVGKGEQTLTEISADRVVTHLHFIEPWDGEADAITTLTEADGKTTVTWAYEAPGGFMSTVMGWFMDMDEMLGPDFQAGMDNLNALVMANKANRSEFGGYTIEKTDMGSRTYIGKKDSMSLSALGEYFNAAMPKMYGDVMKAKVEVAGMPGALYYSWEEEAGTTEMTAAIPVPAGTIVKGYETYTVSGPALKIDYYGPYEEAGKAHEAMEAYMKWHGVEFRGPAVLEEYANDPQTVSDPSEIHTIIYYPIAG